MYVAIVGNSLGNLIQLHAGTFTGANKADLIARAIKIKGEWEQNSPSKEYHIFLGEILTEVFPTVQYREVPFKS